MFFEVMSWPAFVSMVCCLVFCFLGQVAWILQLLLTLLSLYLVFMLWYLSFPFAGPCCLKGSNLLPRLWVSFFSFPSRWSLFKLSLSLIAVAVHWHSCLFFKPFMVKCCNSRFPSVCLSVLLGLSLFVILFIWLKIACFYHAHFYI